MEELVQAINNLSKISTTDTISLVVSILSFISTVIFSGIVVCQNYKFNKENGEIQKNLNEIENKRMAYNTILSIYHEFMRIKINMERLNEDDLLSSIIIWKEECIRCSQDIERIGVDVDYALTKAKMFFMKMS